MVNPRKYTDQQFVDAVRQSPSIRQTLHLLGLKEAGGNYRSCQNRIKSMKLDTSHFEGGRSWSKGRKFGHKRKLEVYLNNEMFIQSHDLRLRLLSEGYFKPQCSMCNLSIWLDNPISLELDHIDGDHKNNNLKNLRLLCPNCHATTDTYRGKNVGRGSRSRTDTST